MEITGYYDGTSVVTDYKFALNQKVRIIPIEDDEVECSIAGMLSEYANPDLISLEKEAWRNATIKKYEK